MDLKEKIKTIIAEIAEINPQSITDDTKFKEDLELDSMLSLEVLAELEHEFSVKISEEELVNFTTLNSVVDIVRSCMNDDKVTV